LDDFKSYNDLTSQATIDLLLTNAEDRFIKTFDGVVVGVGTTPVLTYYNTYRSSTISNLGAAFAELYIANNFMSTVSKMPTSYMSDLKTQADASDNGAFFDIYL